MKYINFNVLPNYIGRFEIFGQTQSPVVVHMIEFVRIIIVVIVVVVVVVIAAVVAIFLQ
jgi:hypothetical protein